MKVQIKSGTMNYLDRGTGPAVLLIHAFPLNHAMWQPQIAPLAADHRVIAPDVRGFGESVPASPWTIEDLCNDLDELLETLGVEECAVAGVSMGGYIALPFWVKYPKRVRKLVLSNTRARADNDAEKAARNDMIAALEQKGASILPERMLSRLLQPNPKPDVASAVRGMIVQAGVSAAIHAVMAMRDRPDSSTALRRITCPTMVLTGENDVIIRVDDCRAMAESIPGSRFVTIPRSGHLSSLENPEDFNRALLDFLRS
ncbi:MAG: alpha/beta fold hydrolase [Acidobacteria bacterium]|nr:alpha/beta fold hydrolase [Acidobacteriota bacterium]